MPITIRVPYGGGIGAVEHHSESPEGYFAATAGLRVVTCGNAADAYTMIQQAIACRRPGAVLRAQAALLGEGRHWTPPPVRTRCTRPAYSPRAPTSPSVAYGPLVTTALRAAEAARAEGISIEVIDLRSLSPLDMDTICESVQRTGRLVVTHEAPVFLGIGAEIAARVTERCFYHLEAPVARVGGFALPYPPAKLEEHYLPDIDRMLDAVDTTLTH